MLSLLPVIFIGLIAYLSKLGSCDVSCDLTFKVYVYPIPDNLVQNAEAARSNRTFHICKKCIYEQFALEYIVYDYFTQFCGRTYDPNEADYFYLPIIRDIDYRIALQTGQRAPSLIESALLDAIEKKEMTAWKEVFNVTDEYWNRHYGADHIIVMPAPVTNLRHQSNMRGFFHYMIQLNAPIFLNVEFSRSFVEEYPICAYEKNVVMPYPTTDSDFFSGRLFLPNYPNITRDKLVFYQGGHHGSCDFVRAALVSIIKNKKLALYWGDKKREAGFQSAAFCPIPVGDSPSSKRMYDVMNFGCIPVVLSDDLIWAYTTAHPTADNSNTNISNTVIDPMHINVTEFSIHLPQNIVQKTATYMLQYNVLSEGDVNYGRPLPSGRSLYALLKEVAAEEAMELQLLSGNETSVLSDSNTTIAARLLTQTFHGSTEFASSVLMTADDHSLTRRILAAKPNNKNHNSNNNNKPPPKPIPGALPEGHTNTLVRLLQKIDQSDISVLQQAVMRVAPSYRYYEFNQSLPVGAPPMTAEHTYPSGGAMKQLERMLTIRKAKGVVAVSERCQVERNQKHKYIGRYPCEKRRLRRRRLEERNGDVGHVAVEPYDWVCK